MAKKKQPPTYEETHDHGLPELDFSTDDNGLTRWEVVQPDGHWGVWRTGAHADHRTAVFQGRKALGEIIQEHFPSEWKSWDDFWKWFN